MLFLSRSLACDITNEAGYKTTSRMSAVLVSLILKTARMTKRNLIKLPWQDQVYMAAIAVSRNPTASDYIMKIIDCSLAEANIALISTRLAAVDLGTKAGSEIVKAHVKNPPADAMNPWPK